MIYIDMDGVLTDFVSQIKKFFDYDLKHNQKLTDENIINSIKKDSEFWNEMRRTDIAPHILQNISNPFMIVSCYYNDLVKECKFDFISNSDVVRISNFQGIIFVPIGTRKADIVKPQPNDLLIDDNHKEIEAWQTAGGQAYHITPDFDIEHFKKFMEEYNE